VSIREIDGAAGQAERRGREMAGYGVRGWADIMLDTSDLTGDAAPVSLAEFLAANAECGLGDGEEDALCALAVGATCQIGIGGGYVTIRRVG
jgi:hypothetical protein